MTLRMCFAALAVAFAVDQTLSAQHDAPAAAHAFKNLTVLKDAPADQILPSMQFMSVSLGVECSFCHVTGKMDADDKPAKKTAREMMLMTTEINKTNFGGRPQMSCYSCHRGATHPMSVPAVLESDAPAKPAAVTTPIVAGSAATTADQIVEKYIAAVGGAGAMKKVTSRTMTGKILAGGSETPIDVLTMAPNRRVTITHGAADSFTAFDGTAGWMGTAGKQARVMSEAESSASALDSEFYLPLRLKEMYPQMRRGRPDTIAGVECETLNGTAAGHPSVRLYFDKSTGLLVRMVRYAETPLGRMPTQIDYSDYRETDGVKTPFRWTLARPNGRFTIQIAGVKNNARVDEGRFARPAGEVK